MRQHDGFIAAGRAAEYIIHVMTHAIYIISGCHADCHAELSHFASISLLPLIAAVRCSIVIFAFSPDTADACNDILRRNFRLRVQKVGSISRDARHRDFFRLPGRHAADAFSARCEYKHFFSTMMGEGGHALAIRYARRLPLVEVLFLAARYSHRPLVASARESSSFACDAARAAVPSPPPLLQQCPHSMLESPLKMIYFAPITPPS